ncbi:MAG: hypothetical protein HWQ35_24245 [Nostoc sp. NMS1]|nr:hypothetical protein [Nostoc sp. NMS1]MBN3990900.1 hypothetical protein [Nostoc sp. NMS2]
MTVSIQGCTPFQQPPAVLTATVKDTVWLTQPLQQRIHSLVTPGHLMQLP